MVTIVPEIEQVTDRKEKARRKNRGKSWRLENRTLLEKARKKLGGLDS